jgi:hypothetical protein
MVNARAKHKWWTEDTTKPFVSGETRLIQIILEEVDGTPRQSEFFTLDFIGLVEARNPNDIPPSCVFAELRQFCAKGYFESETIGDISRIVQAHSPFSLRASWVRS